MDNAAKRMLAAVFRATGSIRILPFEHTAMHDSLQQYRLRTIRNDDRIFLRDNALESLDGIVEHNVVSANIEKLLGNLLSGQRPEAGSAPACKDRSKFIHDASPNGQ